MPEKLTGAQGRKLQQTRALLAAREAALAQAVQNVLRRIARAYSREAVANVAAYMPTSKRLDPAAVAKVDLVDERGDMRADLISLLLRYGLRTAADATNGTAGEVIIPPQMVSDAMKSKDVRIKWFWAMREGVETRVDDALETTKTDVREYVRSLITGALEEYPRPSVGEMARRIRNTLYSGEGRVYSFSSERAAIIARTEVGQAHAKGQAEGYYATSRDEDELEWLSYSGGGRGHETMRGKRITIADSRGNDESRWFLLPSGVRIRYPRDPDAPIGETINCRCDVRKISARTRS
jgi:hypothetical protein